VPVPRGAGRLRQLLLAQELKQERAVRGALRCPGPPALLLRHPAERGNLEETVFRNSMITSGVSCYCMALVHRYYSLK